MLKSESKRLSYQSDWDDDTISSQHDIETMTISDNDEDISFEDDQEISASDDFDGDDMFWNVRTEQSLTLNLRPCSGSSSHTMHYGGDHGTRNEFLPSDSNVMDDNSESMPVSRISTSPSTLGTDSQGGRVCPTPGKVCTMPQHSSIQMLKNKSVLKRPSYVQSTASDIKSSETVVYIKESKPNVNTPVIQEIISESETPLCGGTMNKSNSLITQMSDSEVRILDPSLITQWVDAGARTPDIIDNEGSVLNSPDTVDLTHFIERSESSVESEPEQSYININGPRREVHKIMSAPVTPKKTMKTVCSHEGFSDNNLPASCDVNFYMEAPYMSPPFSLELSTLQLRPNSSAT